MRDDGVWGYVIQSESLTSLRRVIGYDDRIAMYRLRGAAQTNP